MAEQVDAGRTRVSSTTVGFDFELTEEQKRAVIDCIQRTGKLTLNLRRVGTSELPGRGLLHDVEGELID